MNKKLSIALTIMKNLDPKEGWLNRHIDGLPDKDVKMEIIHHSMNEDDICLCNWHPFKKENYRESDMPGEGYLGTVRLIESQKDGKRYTGIGFHAWGQNNSEFVYYRII